MLLEAEAALTADLKREAARLGFDQIGVTPAVAPAGFEPFQAWLRDGFHAGMSYMERHEHARSHPDSILEGVRSIIVCSLVYGDRAEAAPTPSSGKVARYARGADYHQVFWDRLAILLEWLQHRDPTIRGRIVADTAPLLERDFARLAGLGWTGKNTMLINRRLGSFTLLGSILIDRELAYDAASATDHCGSCTRCLDGCPTGAFDGPYRLDANKCLSYWTIEHRGPIPEPIASQLDGWVFGCDICQDVCPWNRKAPAGHDPQLAPRANWTDPDLIAWLVADSQEFRRKLKGTALSRAKRSGLIRNAALILGERKVLEAEPALVALLDDDDTVIQSACAWALGRLATATALRAVEAWEVTPDRRSGTGDPE